MKKQGCWGLPWQTVRGARRTPAEEPRPRLSLHSQEKKQGLGVVEWGSRSPGRRPGSVGQARSQRHVLPSSPCSLFSLCTRSAHLPFWVIPVDDLLLTFGLHPRSRVFSSLSVLRWPLPWIPGGSSWSHRPWVGGHGVILEASTPPPPPVVSPPGLPLSRAQHLHCSLSWKHGFNSGPC